MKSLNNSKRLASTEHKINILDQIQQEFIMQEYHLQSQIHQNHLLQYNNLLNEVLFVTESKKQKKDYFKKLIKDSQGVCFNEITRNSNSVSRLVTQLDNEKEELQASEKKINEQQEIKNHLLKDINQITKSINLLKSDIGRIIHKTESTTILQKKTNKAKVLVNDQLKKVSFALQKDHAEINQTNNLQIKFNNKLKSIGNNQKLSLFRIKQNFIQIKKREEYIYSRINQRTKIIKNLNEREKIREFIKILAQKNRLKLSELLNMVGFVKDISKQEYKSLQIEYNEQYSSLDEANNRQKEANESVYSQNIDNYLYLRSPSFKTKIKQIQNYLIKFIALITASLNTNNWLYEQNLNKASEDRQQLKQLEEQYFKRQEEINDDNGSVDIDFSGYQKKYRDFKDKVKVILGFWCFIENNAVLTQEINRQKYLQSTSRKRNNKKLEKRQSSDLVSPQYFTQDENYYMNQLYNLTLYLGNLLQDYKLQQYFLFQEVELYIVKWLKGLKAILMKGNHGIHVKRFASLEPHPFKSTMDLLLEQRFKKQLNLTKQRISQRSNSDFGPDPFKLMLALFNKKSKFCQEKLQKKVKMSKQMKTEGHELLDAPQRIKYIKKMETQHHKLLKDVLKCEKQNNLKDYTFKKQFTRTKYAEKDIVQQQKRYQANFGIQMKPRKNKTNISQRFGQNRLKTLNIYSVNRRSMNDIDIISKRVKRSSKYLNTDPFSRYSLCNEAQCNMMLTNGFKLQFNHEKLGRTSKMRAKHESSDRSLTRNIHSKISFVEGEPQQFY